MASPWQFDDASKRYRNTATGRYMSAKQMLGLRDQFTDAMKGRTDGLVSRVAGGDLTAQQWSLEMRKTIKQSYIDQYVLARGGRQNMTQRDWGIVGNMTRRQYEYLQGFERDLRDGKLSEGQAQVRARLYIESSTQAYERGISEGLGMPRLPAYPGDGQTQCRTNCRCHWQIEDMGDEWACTWTLGAAEHCDDCIANAARWAPLLVPKARL